MKTKIVIVWIVLCFACTGAAEPPVPQPVSCKKFETTRDISVQDALDDIMCRAGQGRELNDKEMLSVMKLIRFVEDTGSDQESIYGSEIGAKLGDPQSLSSLLLWARTGNASAAYAAAVVMLDNPRLGTAASAIEHLEQAAFLGIDDAITRLRVVLAAIPNEKARLDFWIECEGSGSVTSPEIKICRRALNRKSDKS